MKLSVGRGRIWKELREEKQYDKNILYRILKLLKIKKAISKF